MSDRSRSHAGRSEQDRSEQDRSEEGRPEQGRWMLVRPRAAGLPGGASAATAVVCREMTLACAPVLLPAAAVAAVSVWAGWLLPLVLAGTVLLLWAGFVVHEAGHACALRLLARDVAAAFSVDARGAGVHRPVLAHRGREAVVLLAGPTAPVVLWAAAAVPALLLEGAGSLAWVVWTGMVAWGHPVSLLAPVGDGRALLDVVRRA